MASNNTRLIPQGGSDRPALKYLRLVRELIADKWYDIGLELLEQKDEHTVNIIKRNNAGNISECCMEMLELWLRKQPKATWNQLIEALLAPDIELNNVASRIEEMLLPSANAAEGSSKKTPDKDQEQPPPSSQVALVFSPDEDIDYAFTRLSASVKNNIRGSNYDLLQEACIEKASSPKSQLSSEFISKIEYADCFRSLCLTLATSTHWNFLDLRMMEAMVTASMVPAAQESLKNFKKVFFGMKLSQVVPHFVPVIPLKPGHTTIDEVLNKDPRQFTIGELHKHHFYLEKALLETGEGTLSYYRIMVGSVIIVWQIHVDYVYQAHMLLEKKRSQLLSLAIMHLSIPDTVKWEGLPVLWRGQDVGEIGPIELPSDKIREQPCILPNGFEWVTIDPLSDEIYEFLSDNDKSYDRAFMRLYTTINRHGEIIGIRSSENNKPVFAIGYIPFCVRIRGKLLQVALLQQFSVSDYNHLYNAGIKEVMRKLMLNKIFQAIFHLRTEIIRPIVTFTTQFFNFTKLNSLPYNTPKTTGLRKITPKDIPSALAVTNQYTSQFEIGQVFQSEEEFSCWFLPSSLSTEGDQVVTYVVEDPITGSITDLFSLVKMPPVNAVLITAIVATKTPARQLLIDLLLCAQEEATTGVSTMSHFGLRRDIFEEIFERSPVDNVSMYLYNYKYPEVSQDKVVTFHLFS